jgi:hypothetical protein
LLEEPAGVGGGLTGDRSYTGRFLKQFLSED